MKISLLLQREPFAQIAARSLARYLTTTTGRRHRVTWHHRPAALGELARAQPGLWLVNPSLNMIFSARAEQRVFANPWREYLRGATPLRTLLQGGYLALHTAPGLRGALAPYHLHVEPELDRAESILILGGNARLRLLDFDRGQVVSILKQGFEHQAFDRELQIRQRHAPPLAPPIEAVLDRGRAFAEPLLNATAAGRMRDKQAGQQALDRVAQALAQWSQASAQDVPWSRWWAAYQTRCAALASRIVDDKAQTIVAIGHWQEQTQQRLLALGIAKQGLRTALSHGDLQSGNVLVQGRRPWLIDWESVDRRVVDYDAWTLALGPRAQTLGRMQRLVKLAQQTTPNPARAEIKSLLFLLEEARFYLEESASGPLFGPTAGTTAFARGLRASLDGLYGPPQI